MVLLRLTVLCASCDDSEVAPGGRCSIVMTFAPTALGTAMGAVTINDNAPDAPQTIVVAGSGIPQTGEPAASLSAGELDFGSQAINTVSTQTLTVTNSGTSDLNISLTALEGEGVHAYSMADHCRNAVVKPNANCDVVFSFSPREVNETYVASYSLADNASDSPQQITIVGVGAYPPATGCSMSQGGRWHAGGAFVAMLIVGALLVMRRRLTPHVKSRSGNLS